MGESGEGNLPPRQESYSENNKWSYDGRFKYYIYRVALVGAEATYPIKEFPQKIELNDDWNEILGRMHYESRDGNERWVPFGMEEDRKLEFLPDSFTRGTFTRAENLSPEDIREVYGIAHIAGEIHSHPTDWFNKLGIKTIVAARLVRDYEGYSADDLYNMVNGQGYPISVVVEKDHNFFAFRTKETEDIPANSPLRKEMAFTRYWCRKYGGYFLTNSPFSFWAKPSFSLQKMNMGIAEAYNLALYKSRSGEDLVRYFP